MDGSTFDQINGLHQRVAALEAMLIIQSGRVSEIAADAARLTGIPLSSILSQRRTQPISAVRAAIAWTARQALGRSAAQIGQVLGGRDASTISHSIGRAVVMRRTNPDFKRLTSQLLELAHERNAA